jgi:hypothetical protein
MTINEQPLNLIAQPSCQKLSWLLVAVSDVAINSRIYLARIQFYDLYCDYQTCDLRLRLVSLFMCVFDNDCSPTRSNLVTVQIQVKSASELLPVSSHFVAS